MRLRMRLFEAVISPTVLYSLDTIALSEYLFNRIDITQRKMLRSIIGWRFRVNETWEERGHHMKEKLEILYVVNCFTSETKQIEGMIRFATNSPIII